MFLQMVDSRITEGLMRQIAREMNATVDELEVFQGLYSLHLFALLCFSVRLFALLFNSYRFKGVCVRLPTHLLPRRGVERFAEGLFVFSNTQCLFHTLEGRHNELDFQFALNQV
jgi:hypothetical protein